MARIKQTVKNEGKKALLAIKGKKRKHKHRRGRLALLKIRRLQKGLAANPGKSARKSKQLLAATITRRNMRDAFDRHSIRGSPRMTGDCIPFLQDLVKQHLTSLCSTSQDTVTKISKRTMVKAKDLLYVNDKLFKK